MMGIKARAFEPLPPVSLEELVPADHFYRQLERVLDLDFVRNVVGDTYAGIGRPSVDPVVFFKLQLILFFEGLRSERQLMRMVADRLSLRWYLGYDLTEALPDHSSLTRIRNRYGLAHAGRPDRDDRSGTYRRTADFRVSTTDLDATPMPSGRGRTHLGYHDHYVVDGGRARIILGTLVTPAEVQDNQPAVDLLWRSRFRWKLHPQQVTADAKYGTVENIVAVEQEQIHLYVPLSEVGQRAGVFGEQEFRYDPVADIYHCPGGKELRFLSESEATHRRIYQASAADCKACVLREQCTSSPRGRRISRSLDEDVVDRVRGYHATAAYAKAMRKRKVWVEPLFAEAKEWHGLRRFRLRGAEKVNIQAQLIAAGQNLKRLLSMRGWGRRPWPGGATGVVLAAVQSVAASPQ